MPSQRFLSLSVLLLGLLCSLLTSCSQAPKSGDLKTIRDRGVLTVGVFGDIPPFGYVKPDGSNAGYDVFIAHEIAKDLLGDASKVHFVLLEPSNRVAFLESGKVDVVLANFTVTPERSQVVDFTRAYMKVALGVIAPKTSSLHQVSDLKGKSLIVTKGTTAENFFTKLHPEIEQLKFTSNTEAFQALVDGRAPALTQDNTLLFAWAESHPDFHVIEGNLGNADLIAGAVKKGNTELLSWLNQELAALGQRGRIRAAYDAELKPFFGDSVKDPASVIAE